jgi:threonine synthase
MARSTYLERLRCSETGDTLQQGTQLEGLLTLSPAGKPIICDYDLDSIRADVDRDRVSASDRRWMGMWRWRELLPLPLSEHPISLGEGDTPLQRASVLEAELGIERLWIKDEGTNPTGSFKARGMSAAVTMAKHLGARALIVPSAGNAGGAMAAYGACAQLPTHVYVPADTPEINQREVVLYGGRLEVVDGLIDACGRQAAADRESLDAFPLSTLKEPYRLEGKKTMGLELAEQLGWRVPDVILYPTGGGTGLIGMHKAFDELISLGWISSDKRPRMVCVQASGCAPMVRAFEQGDRFATPWEDATTCASGLRVPGAVGDFLIQDALRESQGTAIAVSDDDLVADMKALSAATGVCAAPEGGACLTALRELRARNWIRADEEVVLFNTGAGSKYVEVMRRL